MSMRRAIAVVGLGLAGGCAGPLNHETGIGNAGRSFGRSVYAPATIAEAVPPASIEGLEPSIDQRSAPVYQASGAAAPADATPSLVSLDRENWAATRVDVPNNFPAHPPLLKRDYIVKSSDPRAAGRYPDERTALGGETTRRANEQFVEALVAPFVAASDVALMPVRGVMEMRPRRPTRTGGEGYVRTPPRHVMLPSSGTPVGDAVRIGGLHPRAAPVPAAYPAAATPALPAPPVPVPEPEVPAEELRPGGGMPATDSPARRP